MVTAPQFYGTAKEQPLFEWRNLAPRLSRGDTAKTPEFIAWFFRYGARMSYPNHCPRVLVAPSRYARQPNSETKAWSSPWSCACEFHPAACYGLPRFD